MDLDNVRELKASMTRELSAPAAAFVGATRSSLNFGLAIAAQATAGLDVVHRTMALGVIRRGKKGFHLAVRLQRREMESSTQLERLRAKAKGEIDVRYVGRLVKRARARRAGGAKRPARGASPVQPADVAGGAWYQRRCRPLRIGCSIGHYRITAGTLGAFVKDANAGTTYVLSNNHVLANENNAAVGDEILQPGGYDGGTRPADVVGDLARFVQIATNAPNLVDCAVARVAEGIAFDAKTITGLGQLAGLGPDFLDEGAIVHKLGRTTGLTRGRVTAFELDNVVVAYDIGNVRFDNQIEIEGADDEAFSDGGDSGSLIVDDDRLAVGLLFAGGDTGGSNGHGLTYANPIGTVLGGLGVGLL